MKKFKNFTAVAGAAEDLEGTSSDIKASIEDLSSDDSIFSGSPKRRRGHPG